MLISVNKEQISLTFSKNQDNFQSMKKPFNLTIYSISYLSIDTNLPKTAIHYLDIRPHACTLRGR